MSNCFWSDFSPQYYRYCESQLCGWLQQPANTWSNVGYLIAAILIFRSDKKTLERQFFFWSTFILFIGSTLFHMSGAHFGKMIDVGAMLALSMGICALSIERYFYWDRRRTQILFLSGLTVSLVFLYIFDIGNIPFSIELLIAGILEIKMIREGRGKLIPRIFFLALFIEFCAVVVLLLDLTRTWCDPNNHIINGHAVWHLLSAAAIYTFFRAQKSQT